MQGPDINAVHTSVHTLHSHCLQRQVRVDVYQAAIPSGQPPSLLLLNDGQDLEQIHFASLLGSLLSAGMTRPLVCVGIHATHDRLQEYSMAHTADHAGRGARAGMHQQFVVSELLPFVQALLGVECFASVGYAGFSLGGLSALDAVWNHSDQFQVAGVFSGSLWWRSHDLGPGYDDDLHRIMHQQVRKGSYHPGLRFYFTTGALDETADRNNNGVIDSIDDTLDLVAELRRKGYDTEWNLNYINYEDGRHDVASWRKALPRFLLWGWGR